jgi:beta-phosphoglucomutase-like phosphatase (HAD superfamily)
VETQLSRLEAVAMASAPMTPGMADAVRDLHQSGFTVTAVSNNSAEVVRSFLVIHDLAPHIRRISARTSTDLTLLTPNPHLVEQAISSLGTSPQFCVMVANSPADIQAAEAASVTVIESLDQLRLEPHSG